MDHLVFVSYRYDGPWADGEIMRDKSKIFDSHDYRGHRLARAGKVDDDEIFVTPLVAQAPEAIDTPSWPVSPHGSDELTVRISQHNNFVSRLDGVGAHLHGLAMTDDEADPHVLVEVQLADRAAARGCLVFDHVVLHALWPITEANS